MINLSYLWPIGGDLKIQRRLFIITAIISSGLALMVFTQNCAQPLQTDSNSAPVDQQSESLGVGCEWPKFPRAQAPLKTKNQGKCNQSLADQYGGDCENFHWKGLMGDPTVIRDQDGKFKMWFTSGELIGAGNWMGVISYAESDDGVLWEDPKDLNKDAIAVFPPGTPGIDEHSSETAFVFKEMNGSYTMFFTGDRTAAPDSLHVIGRAESVDGRNWIKDSTPALTGTLSWEAAFSSGSGQVGGVLEPSVLVDSSGYHMWYQGFGQWTDTPAYARFGYAHSKDGRNWVKQPDPVFVGNSGSFDRLGVGHVNVIRDSSGRFHMFYVGIGEDEVLRLGHAASKDGKTWTRNPNNPILEGKSGEWDAGFVGGPSAIILNNEIYLYYMGSPTKDFIDVHFARTKAVCVE